ncbi:N-acetylmuramoyl-L-alanine amidase [Vibrio sp. CK2-1]|uniref:LysM peptidoglycan-binding domain-containing protein n=1 Tax=Vibrio sp. CK2-1 TaxID=2912249 RepID=UPI001F016E0F|nr:N-acetylmuramoyl-L-alanine amidase [Vibrio sp. CK2-1]MCF7355671.1 N-acetylmuramoyl-L-alanine amidase [Vibrio sp. CK2-1]
MMLWLGAIASANANSLNSIRVWPSPHDTRVVMDMGSEAKFSYFTLSGPDRLVLDLKQTQLKTKLPIVIKDSPVLTKIRHSTPAEPSSYRLVFELKSAQKPEIFTLAPTADGQYGHRLVVDFKHEETASTSSNATVAKNATAAKSAPQKASAPAVTTRAIPPSKIVVAIDPGHGGEDPGSIGPTRKYEKHVTLAIAKKVAAKLNSTSNIHAVLTRTGDYYVNLNKRSEIARKNKSLLLVSIHADSYTTAGPRGASVFVLSTRRANTEIGRWVVKKEEQSELLGGGGVLLSKNSNDKNVSQTVLDLQFSHSQTEGNKLALKVIQELRQVTKMHTSKPVYASLAVLKSPDIPSILVETGFISNPQEEKLLFQNYHQNKLAGAISNAVVEYFKANPPEGMIVVNQSSGSTHKVKSGESLSVIAHNYGTTTANLMKWNNLKSSTVFVGQELKVASPGATSSNSGSTASRSSGNTTVTHVVKSGDYLGKIAEQYSVSVSSIKQQNNLRSNTLKVGQKLQISVPVKTTIYQVRSGDFLGKIADKYGVSISDIRKANNLRSDSLAVGQKLTIPQS